MAPQKNIACAVAPLLSSLHTHPNYMNTKYNNIKILFKKMYRFEHYIISKRNHSFSALHQ